MKRAKVYIEAVDNGFILRVKSQGLSAFKEPYEKTHLVFTDFGALSRELRKLFDLPISDKERMEIAASRLPDDEAPGVADMFFGDKS